MSMSTPEFSRRTHLVPTHIRTPETLITLAGMSLSVRQFLLVLVGIALSYRVWVMLGGLSAWPAGQVVRAVVTAVPLGLVLAFAFVQFAARSLDAWCVAVLRYRLRPHQFVWRSVRFHEPSLGGATQEEESDGEANG